MMGGYDAWKTTPPDVDCDEPEACPHCGSDGPCLRDCATQEDEPYDLYSDNACEVA